MAVGKNKRLSKGGKKGAGKKRVQDPLSRKEWFDFKAPVPFSTRSFGKTCVTKTTGTKISTDQVKGRIVESTLADLKDQSEYQPNAWRKVKLIIDDVEARNCKTSFYGMDITRDKLCSMIRKWQTLIEAYCDCKSADGYIIRIFTIAFTRRNKSQEKKTCYAQHSQVKEIRKKIVDILTKEVAKCSINELVKNLTQDTWTDLITNNCKFVYPLQNVTIRKVKILKRPKIDVVKMAEMYTHNSARTEGAKGGNQEHEDEEVKNLLKTEDKKEKVEEEKPKKK